MLTENKQIDRIEILSNSIIQVRECITIERDGVEITKNYHRWSFEKDSDISFMPKNVQDIANFVWNKL